MATVSKRRWTYEGEIKWAHAVTYTDSGGNRRSKQFKRNKDADAYRLRVENELEAGTHTARSMSITVEAAIRLYLDDRASCGVS